MDLGIIFMDEGMAVAILATLFLTALISIIVWRSFMRQIERRRGVGLVILVSLGACLVVFSESSVGYMRLKDLCTRDGGINGAVIDHVDAIHFSMPYRKNLYEYAKKTGITWVEFDEDDGGFRRYSTSTNEFDLVTRLISRYSIAFKVDWNMRDTWGSDISIGTIEYIDHTNGSVSATLRDYRLARDWWGKSVLPLKKVSCADAFPNDRKYDEENNEQFLKYLTVSKSTS